MKQQNHSLIAVMMMALALAATQDAFAQLDLLPFKKSKATAQTLELQPGSGPWLIMCYSFSGESGLQQAQRLASELRQNYKLKAYTYTHRFDISEKVQQNAVATKKYVRDANGEEVIGADGKPMLVDTNLTSASDSVIVETAVLVGDFASVEDQQAQALLAQIKRLAPKSLAGGDPSALAGADDLAGGKLRSYREAVNRKHAAQGNTLRNSFMLPNPMLPEEYFTAHSIDEFVIKLNRKVRRYSLLDCPGKYSVRIATFRGRTEINSSKIKQQMDDFKWRKRNNKGIQSELAECANKANMLTKALRAEGIEAYEFHDREESYVCVGGFDWLKKVSPSGTETQNPEVRELILKYKGNVRSKRGQSYVESVSVPKSLRDKKIAYDMQPLPVIVPKAPKAKKAGLFSKWR